MKKSGFTMVEILIVITIIALLVIASLILLDPITQLNKAKDGRRTGDLSNLRNVLENYNNDKNHYPPGELASGGVCKDTPNNCKCHICGNSLTPYASKLPCDPQSPTKDYVYEYDCTNPSAPSWYKVYVQ